MNTADPIARSVPLRQQVYEQVRALLRAGRFEAGQRVTEVALAAQLGVSRTPVREALGLLSREGLLEAHVRGGFVVPRLGVQDIDDIFEIRRRLEPYVASRAALLATGEGVSALQTAVTEERAYLDDDEAVAAFAAANARFHATLCAMAGNVRLAHNIETLEDQLQPARWAALSQQSMRRAIISGHLVILDTVRNRDGTAAAQGMSSHLTFLCDAFMSTLASETDREAAEIR